MELIYRTEVHAQFMQGLVATKSGVEPSQMSESGRPSFHTVKFSAVYRITTDKNHVRNNLAIIEV